MKSKLRDQKSLANAILRKLKEEDAASSVTYNDKTQIINWNGFKLFLGNIYEEYSRSSSSETEIFINEVVERLKTIIKDEKHIDSLAFDEALPLLLPVVRVRSYFETIQKDGEIPYFLLNEFIGVGVSLNSEISIIILKEEILKKWDKDFDFVYNCAVQNLNSINDKTFEKVKSGIWKSSWNDGYDASRILCPDCFEQLPLKGEPVILIPHRDVLIVTSSQDNKGLEEAIKLSEEYKKSSRSITSIPFTFQKREEGNYDLKVFSVPKDHPLYPKIFDLMQDSLEAETHSEQSDLIKKEEKKYKRQRKRNNSIGVFFNYYKNISERIFYWNFRFDSLKIIINKGEINNLFESNVIECSSKKEQEKRLESELESIEENGYSQWDLKNAKPLFIRLESQLPGTLEDLEKKYAIIDLMDDYLSKTGFGYCEGADRDLNTISILCVVLNSFSCEDEVAKLLRSHNLLEKVSIELIDD